jgi:hypothetical protein
VFGHGDPVNSLDPYGLQDQPNPEGSGTADPSQDPKPATPEKSWIRQKLEALGSAVIPTYVQKIAYAIGEQFKDDPKIDSGQGDVTDLPEKYAKNNEELKNATANTPTKFMSGLKNGTEKAAEEYVGDRIAGHTADRAAAYGGAIASAVGGKIAGKLCKQELKTLEKAALKAERAAEKAEKTVGAKAGDLGPYRDVGGHHVHAKAAFKGSVNYDLKQGFSISQDFMKQKGWSHDLMTAKQRELFGKLEADVCKGVKVNVMNEHTKIAYESLIAGGATPAEAKALVKASLTDLERQGVKGPTRIPWAKTDVTNGR